MWQALDRHVIDLVVLDLMLPDRDGWSITKIVRDDPALKTLPIASRPAIAGGYLVGAAPATYSANNPQWVRSSDGIVDGALAFSLEELLKNDGLCRTLGFLGRALVIERFDLEANVARLAELFEA